MVAHYARIAEMLRRKIRRGKLPPGAMIAPEVQIAADFGVSRPVVRQAMSLLVNEGYIERTRGRGTVVRKPSPRLSGWVAHSIDELVASGSISSVLAFGRTTTIEIEHYRRTEANAAVASALNIARGATIFELRGVRSTENGPAALQLNYMPEQIGRRLANVDFRSVLTFDALEQKANVQVVRILQAFKAVKAAKAAAKRLKVAAETPLLQVERILISKRNRVVLFSLTQFRCDRYRPVLEFTADSRWDDIIAANGSKVGG